MRRFAYVRGLDMSPLGERDNAMFQEFLAEALEAAAAEQTWSRRLPGFGMVLHLIYVDGTPVSVRLIRDDHLDDLSIRIRAAAEGSGATVPEHPGQVIFEIALVDKTPQYT